MIRRFFDIAWVLLQFVQRMTRAAVYVPGNRPVSGVPIAVVGALYIIYPFHDVVLVLPGGLEAQVPWFGALLLIGLGAVAAIWLVKDAANWLYMRRIVGRGDYIESLVGSPETRFVAALLESVCTSALLEWGVAVAACGWFVPRALVLVVCTLSIGVLIGAASRDGVTARRSRIMRAVDTITGAMAVDASLPLGTDSTRHTVAANAINALRAVSADDAIEVLEVCEIPGNELKADQRHLWEYMFQRIDALRAKRTT